MAADTQLAAGGETIELQQQVARLQALLEASRQVHGTIREEEVLESVLRIVVRELEMAGAAFPGAGLAYGDMPQDGTSGAPSNCSSIRLPTATARSMTDLVVAVSGGRGAHALRSRFS